MSKLDGFFSEVADLLKRNQHEKASLNLESDKLTQLDCLSHLFTDKDKKAKSADLNNILEVNRALGKLESIKELNDEIDHFESKLRLLDQLIQYDGDLREIEKVFILMKDCMRITRNMSLFEEKYEKVELYEEKLKAHLDSKIEDAIKDDDIQTIQSLLHLYAVMEKDYEFLDTLIANKFMPEFHSLKQLKRGQLGPIKYYFESLQEFVERKTDVLIDIFEGINCVKYLTYVLTQISDKYIDPISENFLEENEDETETYILEKLTKINDVVRTKLYTTPKCKFVDKFLSVLFSII